MIYGDRDSEIRKMLSSAQPLTIEFNRWGLRGRVGDVGGLLLRGTKLTLSYQMRPNMLLVAAIAAFHQHAVCTFRLQEVLLFGCTITVDFDNGQ